MEDSEEVPEFADQNENDQKKDDKQELPDPAEPNPSTGRVPAAWSSGLCACCNNPCNALVTVFCPCITFGQIAEMVEYGHVSCCVSGLLYVGFCTLSILGVITICCACKYSATYRTKLRRNFNLAEAPALDWITHICCECCALCQEYRELQSRGLDPSLGWKKHAARNQQQTMRPPSNQRMNA